MNGIEKITDRITQDAEAEIAKINAEAEGKAAELTAHYQAQADAERSSILEKGKKAAQERQERLSSMAQMEARKMILATKQEVLDTAYEAALEQLCSLPEDEYVALLAKLAAKAAVTGHEQVILNQTDRARHGVAVVTRANELLKDGGLTLSERTADIRGGLLLQNGSVEMNCGFEALVRLSRNETVGEVAKVLFA